MTPAPAAAPPLLLDGATIDGGKAEPVLVASGRIAAIGPGARLLAERASAERLELSGFVLLPGAAEPHAHLDKALLADRVPNPTGDLLGAIDATRAAYSTMARADVVARARRALRIAVSRGFTAVRTHVSCEEGFGTGAIEALVALRDEVRDTVELQVIAMAGFPFSGQAGAGNRALLLAGLDAGADGVGGAPALDDDPEQAVVGLVRVAAERGLPIDLHLDETLDPTSLTICRFADEVERAGLGGRATASHCVSLGQLDADAARAIAARLAASGVAVVVLPQTNLYLQGREAATRVPRALTAVAALRAAGVVVAGGGDNWRDPFNPLSRIDPLETAALLVAAAHLSVRDAYDAVSTAARRAMGLPDAALEVGAVADLLALRAATLDDAIAHAGEDRVVLRAGRVVAHTRVEHEVVPGL